MLLLVVRYLAFAVVHAVMQARVRLVASYAGRSVVRAVMRKRVNAGAICSTGAASYALTGEIDSACSVSVCAFACAQ